MKELSVDSGQMQQHLERLNINVYADLEEK